MPLLEVGMRSSSFRICVVFAVSAAGGAAAGGAAAGAAPFEVAVLRPRSVSGRATVPTGGVPPLKGGTAGKPGEDVEK